MSEVSGTNSEAWIAEHGRFLRRVSRAILHDDARAEDAVQEAWVAALETPPPRNPLGSPLLLTGPWQPNEGRMHRKTRAENGFISDYQLRIGHQKRKKLLRWLISLRTNQQAVNMGESPPTTDDF